MVQQHCLKEETLANYLEGSLDAPMRTAAEEHLVSCDTCRSQLVYYMRMLDEDIGDDEESVLEAAMERWGEGAAPIPKRPRVVSGRKWMALAASVLVVVSLGLFFGTGNPDRFGSDVVEALASRERPFRARLADQLYFDFVLTRDGQAGSGVAGIDQLVDDLLREGREYSAGVVSLYGGNFDRAIVLLTAAVLEAENPERRNDLGVAYLEKTPNSSAELTRNRALAREQFEAALRLDPDYATAVYNLALWYELEAYDAQEPDQEQQYYLAARAQQDRYLELDSSSEWANEVRETQSALDGAFGVSPPGSSR